MGYFPTYLYYHPSNYIFRIRVPCDIIPHLGKTEIRRSVKTCSRIEALQRGIRMFNTVQHFFEELRRDKHMMELLIQEISSLLDTWFNESLEEDEEDRLTGKPKTELEHMALSSAYTDLLDEVHADLVYNNYSRVSRVADDLLENEGMSLDSESLSYKRLCRKLLKRQVQLYKILMNREDGKFEWESIITPATQTQTNSKPTETISEVIKQYVSESESGWTEKTKSEIVDDSLKLFLEIVGDVPLQAVDRRKMNEFKQTIRKLPPNRNKLKKYRNKTINQLVKMRVDKPLSEGTINKHFTRIGTLFDYAITNGFYDGPNPALKMRLPRGRSSDESRAPFDLKDLEKLFHSEQYLNDTHTQPYQFWTPIIALFTGMRQNEIAQLYLDDIRQEGDVWYFDVNKDTEDKSLKSPSSKRKVPLHDVLANKLKLPEYAAQLRSKGQRRLFPELPRKRDGYAATVSRWFNERYKTKCGIVLDDRMKDFHSFRTTWINNIIRKRGISERMWKRVVGHSTEKDTAGKFYSEVG